MINYVNAGLLIFIEYRFYTSGKSEKKWLLKKSGSSFQSNRDIRTYNVDRISRSRNLPSDFINCYVSF